MGPIFMVKMWCVSGLKPMLNSPWLLWAEEPVGAAKIW